MLSLPEAKGTSLTAAEEKFYLKTDAVPFPGVKAETEFLCLQRRG